MKKLIGAPPTAGLDAFSTALMVNSMPIAIISFYKAVLLKNANQIVNLWNVKPADSEFKEYVKKTTGIEVPEPPYYVAFSNDSIQYSLNHEYQVTMLEQFVSSMTFLQDKFTSQMIMDYSQASQEYVYNMIKEAFPDSEQNETTKSGPTNNWAATAKQLANTALAVALGLQYEAPDFWYTSSAPTNISLTVKLYCDNPENQEEYEERILKPLSIFLAMGAANNITDFFPENAPKQGGSGKNVFNSPFFVRLCIPGVITIPRAGVASVNVTVDTTKMTFTQKPRFVTVDLTFVDLWRVIAAKAQNEEGEFLSAEKIINIMKTGRQILNKDDLDIKKLVSQIGESGSSGAPGGTVIDTREELWRAQKGISREGKYELA